MKEILLTHRNLYDLKIGTLKECMKKAVVCHYKEHHPDLFDINGTLRGRDHEEYLGTFKASTFDKMFGYQLQLTLQNIQLPEKEEKEKKKLA